MANAPVVVMPRAVAADFSRAVIGPDHLAEPARVIIALRIVGRRVAVVARAEVVAMMKVGAARPDMMMPDNSRRGKTVAATAKYGATAAETTAVNGCTTAAEATAATKATASTATETAAATMAASDFSRQSVGSVLCGRRRTGIDQRQSLGALARRDREQQHRSRRKTEAAHRAPRIQNVQHA